MESLLFKIYCDHIFCIETRTVKGNSLRKQDSEPCVLVQSPAMIADYSVVANATASSEEDHSESAFSHVVHPTLDYVPPELISLFITDTGGHTTSYVYRLLAEYYTREDYALSQELLNGCPL